MRQSVPGITRIATSRKCAILRKPASIAHRRGRRPNSADGARVLGSKTKGFTLQILPTAQSELLAAETVADRSNPGRDHADRGHRAVRRRDDVIGNALGPRHKRIIVSEIIVILINIRHDTLAYDIVRRPLRYRFDRVLRRRNTNP